jgi:hypothetical protein
MAVKRRMKGEPQPGRTSCSRACLNKYIFSKEKMARLSFKDICKYMHLFMSCPCQFRRFVT